MDMGRCSGAAFSIAAPRRDVGMPGLGGPHSAGLKNKGELYYVGHSMALQYAHPGNLGGCWPSMQGRPGAQPRTCSQAI